ncbi:pentatricopeptide repeat-containing protein At4g21300-like [Actinidia eriantha]|uniref:pentatricopeptide repeat-containing protein At4g21300-like n=1 Tax=Actinidia eriantha TaxID=165200 RepID=UPI00258687E0|nr:pentatricopeptide repeat-containing protein At4g21300-like [Actinidia eriantha]
MSSQYHFHTTHFLHHCSQTKNLRALKKAHAHLLRTGLLFLSLGLHTNLIFTYTKCLQKTHLQTLTNLFTFVNPKNPLPLNALISDFRRKGCSFLSLKTFAFMHINVVPIDTYTLCSSLTACSDIKTVEFGKQLHTHVIKLGWSSSVFVGSALIDLYAKLLLIDDAAVVFDEMPMRNTVCANALLSGYAEAKLWAEGLELVRNMPMLKLNYDSFTLSATLLACGGLSAIELGGQVHAKMIRTVHNVVGDVFLQSSLIEMYGKCGLVQKARRVFSMAGFRIEGERKRDVVLWTSMLGVYGKNGHFKEVIGLYNEMLMEGVKPDGVAFVTVISACGHTGQVNLGIEYFESMVGDFGLDPKPEHYSCLIDLLCRAGELEKAWKLVNEMSYKANGNCTVSMWGALLSACNECGNVDLAKLAAQRALELDPQNVGIYVLLSNMYARYGMWNEISQLREVMMERLLEKDVGCSWIEVRS